MATLCISPFVTVTVADLDQAAGLAGHWGFDENFAGATVVAGDPQLVPGLTGKAVRLDGRNDALALSDDPALQSGELTVAFWIRRLAPDWSFDERVVFWSKRDTDWTGDGWFLNIDGRGGNEPVKMVVGGTNSFGVRGDNNIFYPPRQWVHVAVSFSSADRSMAVYRNGEPQEVQVINGNPEDDDFVIRAPEQAMTYLGFNGPTWRSAFVHAEIDDIRIYNRVVEPELIAMLADVEIPPPMSGQLVLRGLKINGRSIDYFDPHITEYSVQLPQDTKSVDIVAEPADANSTVKVTVPESLPGEAQIMLTDAEGESITYAVRLIVERDWGPGGYDKIAPYRHGGIHEGNAAFADSARFRLYYGHGERRGPKGNLGRLRPEEVQANLEYLEAIYDQFINELGYRSPGLSVHDNVEGPFKINVYTYEDLNAGGYMGYDNPSGLSYVILHNNAMNRNMRFGTTLAHEFGHCINLAEKGWNEKFRTGAYWETFAQFVAEEFGRSRQFAELAKKYDRPTVMSSFNVNTVIANSHLSIIHRNNRYQNFMFFCYLTQNPDDIEGLGIDVLQRMIANHEDQETPIHTLDRLTPDVSAQEIMARYNARLAYMDFENREPRNRLDNRQRNRQFLHSAYANLENTGENRFRVKENRRPMYGGSNIIPLELVGAGPVVIEVANLGNGLEESDFTAMLAVRDKEGGISYHLLDNGKGELDTAEADAVVLVVTNTPGVLYMYCAFQSKPEDPEQRGLNYEVLLRGAKPKYM